MEIAFFILGMIGVLGSISIYRNSQKKSIISKVINDYLQDKEGQLVEAVKSDNSGPFDDEYFDEQSANLYHNVGYQAKETIYKKVIYTTQSRNQETVWLQLRIENLKATYVAWK
jgi:hypothetical protein